MLDLAIRRGDVVDGSGSRRRNVDVGIVNGRVVEVGEVGAASSELDATGRIVAPGFVDVHSHFDAQVFWDPSLTPSSLHGVTTTVAGNCGFTLAPLAEGSGDYIIRMLAVVEGMPLESLIAAVPADWRTTGEFLDRIEGTLAINAGFLVGHSTLRRAAMGTAATQREATPAEAETMVRLLRDGLDAGGLGFSTSRGPAHFDGDGDPVPSVFATVDELQRLAAVCSEFEGTSLEFAPSRVDRFTSSELDLLTAMSVGAQRPLNWNLLRIGEANAALVDRMLAAGPHARDRGGKIVALNMPIPSRARFSFRTGFVLDALPGWGGIFALPLEERVAALGDARIRRELERGVHRAEGPLVEMADFGHRVIAETFTAEAAQYRGRLVSEIAAAEGKTALNALLDIVCSDQLGTTFCRPPSEPSRGDWIAMVASWRDGGTVIGASDAGAHLDFTAYFDYPLYVLEKAVRQHGALELEEAIRFMTDVPARLYGLRDRGRLAPGFHADVVIFDEATVATTPLSTRFDMPSGAGRLYAEPIGIDYVLVNGVPVVSAGALTENRPGTLLRSGRDTTSPTLD